MVKRRSIEERIADTEKHLAELKARKDGGTLMGSKHEAQAFRRALNKHKGFGLSYAEMLGALESLESRMSDPRLAEKREAFRVAGEALMAPFLPAPEREEEGGAEMAVEEDGD